MDFYDLGNKNRLVFSCSSLLRPTTLVHMLQEIYGNKVGSTSLGLGDWSRLMEAGEFDGLVNGNDRNNWEIW